MTLSPISSVPPLVATSNIATTSSKTVCDLNSLQEVLISKGIITNSGEVIALATPPPQFPEACQKRLDELLDTPVLLKSKKELKPLGEINLRRLLTDLGNDFEVVGSMVSYILGLDYLEALLAGHQITLDPSFKKTFADHFKKGSDIDLRAKPRSSKPLGTFQGQLCEALAAQLKIDEYTLSQSAFHKLHAMKGAASMVATLGEDEGHGIDFLIWEKPYRMHFATRDALCLQIATREVSLPTASPLQSLLDHIFKVVRVDSPESVDHNGWSRLLSLRLKGHTPSHPEVEAILLQTLINYEPYKNDIKFLVKLIEFSAKHHHKNDPEAALKMAFLATPVLLSSISSQDFAEFWEKTTSKLTSSPPLARTLASLESNPKTVLLLLRLALPFYQSSYLQLEPLSPEELLSVFKDLAPLEKTFAQLPEIPFNSLNDLLIERILHSQTPYPLWNLLKPHLTDRDLRKYELLIKEKVQGKKELEAQFLPDETLSVAICQETQDDDTLNLFFETLAQKALDAKNEAAKSLSLFTQVGEIGRKHASRLKSHNTYADIVLFILSFNRTGIKHSFNIDFNKIASPQKRVELAAALVSHRHPLTYEIAESDLETVPPTLENDAKVRELLKEGRLKHISASFYFKWVKALIQTLPSQSLKPWMYLFSGDLSGEVKAHKEIIQAVISAFTSQMQDEGEAVIKLIDLAQIDSKPLKEKIAQELSEKDESLSVTLCKETEDDETFNLFFEILSQKALAHKKEAAKSRSLFIQVVEIGRQQASRLKSHNTYAEMALLALSITREGIKNSLNIDFSKISSPQKRIEVAATLVTHRHPLTYDCPESDLETLSPTLVNDAKVRELLKEGHLKRVSPSFYFKWVETLMQSLPTKSLRPWIYLFSGLLAKEVEAYKERVQAFITAFIPQMQDEGEAIIKLLDLAQIDSKPLKEKIAQALSEKKDKGSKELLWKLLPRVESTALWKKAIETPSSAMICVLNHPLDFLPLEVKTTLLKALLNQISEPSAKLTHLQSLQALKLGLPPLIEWVRWLLTLKKDLPLNTIGSALREFNPIPQKERGAWVAKLLELSPDQAKEIDPSYYGLLNFPEIDLASKVKGAFLLGKTDECRTLLKSVRLIPLKVFTDLTSIGVAAHPFLTEILLDEDFKDSIPPERKNDILICHLQRLVAEELKKTSVQSLNQTLSHVLKLYARTDSEQLLHQVTSVNHITKLLQVAVIRDRGTLPLHLAELTLYISYHSTRRSFPGPHCPVSLSKAVEDININSRFITLESLVLPTIDEEASVEEKNQTLLLMFMVAEKLMYIPEMTLEARLFVRDYLMNLLTNLAKCHPKHLILGVPCFDKLSYYIPPAEDMFWYNHWNRCVHLLNLFMQKSTDPAFSLCYLTQKARLDPGIYVYDAMAQLWDLQVEPLPYTYRQSDTDTFDLPAKTLIEEIKTLISVESAYACFRATQLFSYMPCRLFTFHNLSFVMWEMILKASIPYLSETVNGFPLISHMVNAFFQNRFFLAPNCPRQPIDHVRHFLTQVTMAYEKTRDESTLFALYYLLRSAITFNVHENNESDFLEIINILIPFGDIWLKINVNNQTFQPIFDLIAAMNLKEINHKQRALVILASWIDILHEKSPKLRSEVLGHIETCLKNKEYQNFFARDYLLTDFIPSLKRSSP